MPSKTRTGILLALTTAVISGASIYLNKFAVQAMDDVLLFTSLKNTLVGLALIACLVSAGPLRWSRSASGRHWLGLVGLAVLGGSLPFLLFFKGLSTASAPSAALIHKSLFLWVALLAAPLLSERAGRWSVMGLALLAAGQVLSGWPRSWGWGGGESLILIATLLWAGETILAKRLLFGMPTALAAASRMAGGAMVMWAYLFGLGKAEAVLRLSSAQWSWVILTSVLLLGYVTTWYAALKRAPATVVTSVLTLGAVVTVSLSRAAEGQAIAGLAWIGLSMLILGAAIVMRAAGGRRDAGITIAPA